MLTSYQFFVKPKKKNQCRYCTKGIKTLKMQMLPLRYTHEDVTRVAI